MPQNKNALLRYRTIDRCLRNTGRRWTLADLVDACSDALYEYEGKDSLVSVRTVQLDIQMMRSSRLGYEAPIEVYDRKYYRYSDPAYSISNRPLTEHDRRVLGQAIDLLKQFDEFDHYHEMAEVVNRLRDKALEHCRRPIVDFERNPFLKGLALLNPLYDFIASRTTVSVYYQSFRARTPREYVLYPHLLKEYANRWFLFGSQAEDMRLYCLALDRIVGITSRPETPYRENPSFDGTYFDNLVGVTKGPGMEEVTLRFTAFAEQAQYIRTKPIHRTQTIVAQDREGRHTTFEMRLIVNPELVKLLLSFGPGIRVDSPPSLAETIRRIHSESAAVYENSSPQA